jgi:SAM-dependent methyltransferase
MKYTFVPTNSCNMCGSERRKILGRRLNTSQGLRPKQRMGISTTVVKCSDCGLIYADPLPVPESIEQHYGIPPESYWSPGYFNVSPDHFKQELRRIKTIAPDAKTFLDVGCGVGKTISACLSHGLDAHGIEGSLPFYERAAERHNGRIKYSSLEDAEYADSSFDVISFGVVLEHLYDPSAAIEKALKWLKPEGVIHIEVPDSGYLFSKIFNLYFWLCRTDFVVNISPMHSPFHLYEFTEKSFRMNGDKLGHRIAHVDRYAGGTTLTPTLDKLLEPLMNATKTGSGLVVYLQKEH